MLLRFSYVQLKRADKGTVLKYLLKTTGYSRSQLTRLVKSWIERRAAKTPLAKRYRAPSTPFPTKYTAADLALLIEMDRANEDVCGPRIAHLLKRAYNVYKDER